mgnify:CR=1 FL=1
MIKLLLFIIVIILLFVLIRIIIRINNKSEINNDISDTEMLDEYELEDLNNQGNIESFNEVNISKVDYEKIRNDEFNDQFFNFQNRLNGSSNNIDSSVDKVNRFRNSKFGLTNESANGMKIRDISDYFIKH